MGIVHALRQPHLALLWGSQVLSALGDHLYEIAVLWIAVQVASAQAGIVGAAEALAGLLFGLVGGVYADRWNRRTTLIGVDLLRAGAVMILPLWAAWAAIQLWHLVAVAIFVGSLGALFTPALQAGLPALAGDRPTLQATISLMDITRRLARAIGPSLAGLLAARLPLPQFFTLDAFTFLCSAAAIFALGRRWAWQAPPHPVALTRQAGRGAEIVGAVRLVWAYPVVAYALVGGGLVNATWSVAFVVGVPLLTARVLSGDVGAYGLIVGAFGVGNVVSNLVVGTLALRHPVRVMFAGRVIFGAGLLLLSQAHSLSWALGAASLAALGGPMGEILLLTMLHEGFPGNQLGKSYSLRITLANGGLLVGSLLAPPLFAVLDVRLVMMLSAGGAIAVGLLGLARFGRTGSSGGPGLGSPSHGDAQHVADGRQRIRLG